MKTLTIRLPDSLARKIDHESQTRRVSKSDIVRERLHQPHSSPSLGGDTVSELIGDILEESWGAKVPDLPRRFGSPKKQRLVKMIRAKKCHH